MDNQEIYVQSLKKFFDIHTKAALAFSGGTDSAYVLYSALKNGCDIKAYYVKTNFQPEFELRDAVRLCNVLNADIRIIKLDIFNNEAVKNDSLRCYYCKKFIIEAIKKEALKDGYNILLDGTNATDNEFERPGSKSLKQLNVISPLKLCGIKKQDVRILSKRAGLFTWNKPSYSCLATRIIEGVAINKTILEKISESEDYMFSLGFKDFRVRTDGVNAKIEITEGDFKKFIDARKQIYDKLSGIFKEITLNLKAR